MISKKNIDVSIVSANYNNGEFLSTFLDSILNSTYLPREIIIIDDKSTDNSLEVLSNYASSSIIKIIPLDKNQGFANALNIGLEKATCKYIARIDPDDYMHPKRIEEQYNYLEKHPNVAAIGSNAFYFKESTDDRLFRSNFPSDFNVIYKRYLSGEHGLLHGTVMIKSQVIKSYGYRQEHVPAEDYDIFGRIIKDGYIFSNLETGLTGVRIHSNSVSNDLPFNTIKKTFNLRKEIFGLSTSALRIYIIYYHMKYYRKYLFEESKLKGIFYLIISSILRPDKVMKKVKLWV